VIKIKSPNRSVCRLPGGSASYSRKSHKQTIIDALEVLNLAEGAAGGAGIPVAYKTATEKFFIKEMETTAARSWLLMAISMLEGFF
jgi:hypothetical protein